MPQTHPQSTPTKEPKTTNQRPPITASDRARPGYRAWQQKIRGRASRRLQHLHPDDWRRLLTEEQTADPPPR